MIDENERRLPYWPGALSKKMAAAYCGLSPETFDKVCPLKPISFTGSKRGDRFLRHRIDEWLENLDPNTSDIVPTRGFGDRTSGRGLNAGRHEMSEADQIREKLFIESRTSHRKRDPGGKPARPNMREIRQKDHDEWERLFVNTPLGKRELNALKELRDNGIGEGLDEDLFTQFGPNTSRRLWLRGFIETTLEPDEEGPARVVWLTEAGKMAAKDLK